MMKILKFQNPGSKETSNSKHQPECLPASDLSGIEFKPGTDWKLKPGVSLKFED